MIYKSWSLPERQGVHSDNRAIYAIRCFPSVRSRINFGAESIMDPAKRYHGNKNMGRVTVGTGSTGFLARERLKFLITKENNRLTELNGGDSSSPASNARHSKQRYHHGQNPEGKVGTRFLHQVHPSMMEIDHLETSRSFRKTYKLLSSPLARE
jgi:hypothetical protein